MSIDFDRAGEESKVAKLRGKRLEFSDGKEWVIATLKIKDKGSRLNQLCNKAINKDQIEESEFIELVELAVKSNYPDVDTNDINPDLEDMFNVIKQVTGQNLGK